jgi:uncharacterized protein (DUF4415 family)
MSKEIVSHEVDLANPTPLTAQQRAELATLKAMPDTSIDTSDIPPLTDAFWKNAVRNPFYKPTKTATTVRIDSDVLNWLRAQGKGYQSRINAILREAMLSSLNDARPRQDPSQGPGCTEARRAGGSWVEGS